MMVFLKTHVRTGACGLFYHGAMIHWDGTERESVWTAILVWGMPDVGDPLRPAERSQWWVDVSTTTFNSFGNAWMGLRW